MNNGLSKSLGTVLLAAAAFAAAGCTPLGSPNSTPGGAAPAPPATSASAGTEPLGPAPADPAAGAAGSPDAAVAPAPSGQAEAPHGAPEPTFAPTEQKYLASRVPAGTDPNAVLQVGQERCAQLEAVKAADQKAVISQLIEKRDADVADAITGLCPALQPELDAAARGFGDGEFTIGAAAPKDGGGSVSAGTYEAWGPSETCQLLAFDAAGGTIAESNGTTAVTIPSGAARVVSDGCYTWLAS